MNDNKMNLFCFSYAGGSASNFHKWRKYISPKIQLRPVELAGRGRRMGDKYYNDIEEAVDDVFHELQSDLLTTPYAFFGHSMGALISYELAQKVRQANFSKSPLHLFLSGKGAPHEVITDRMKYHKMNDTEFRKEVFELGGTPPSFFEHPELLNLFLPILKNDFMITETYIAKPEISPLDSNITVMIGKQDDLTEGRCEEWRKYTNGSCNFQYFEGGHFFLHDKMEGVINVINDTLLRNCC